MNRFRYLCASAVVSLALFPGCSSPPHGQPETGSEPIAPNQVSNFSVLYAASRTPLPVPMLIHQITTERDRTSR